MYQTPLKNHSLAEIEEAFSVALSNLCGRPIAIELGSFVIENPTFVQWNVKMDLLAKQGLFVGPPERREVIPF